MPAQPGRRRLHFRSAPQPVLRPSASNSFSIANTWPAMTSAISTGKPGRRPIAISSNNTRRKPTYAHATGRRCQRVDALWNGPLNKYEYACTVGCLSGLHADATARLRRADRLRFRRCGTMHARARRPESPRRHRQGDARQQAAREDRHFRHSQARGRGHLDPRHGRFSSRICSSIGSRCSGAWKCSGIVVTT